MGENKDKKVRNKKLIVYISLAAFIVLDIVVILLVYFLYIKNKQPSGDSSSSTTTSEVISSSTSSSSEQPYAPTVLSNLKTYTNNILNNVLMSDDSIKDIYSFNIFEEDGSTYIEYVFTYNADDSVCSYFLINLLSEPTTSETIELIYNNGLTTSMYESSTLYEVVETTITEKDNFKNSYDGIFKGISYIDDEDQHYYSGIGGGTNSYSSLTGLKYDSSYNIDESSCSYMIVGKSLNLYYSTLQSIYNSL